MQYTWLYIRFFKVCTSIEALLKERDKIVLELKLGKQERLKDLQDIDNSIGWIKVIESNDVGSASDYTIDKLPFLEGVGWSDYRLLIDMEVDDTKDWVEFKKTDGEHYLLNRDDILLIRKPGK